MADICVVAFDPGTRESKPGGVAYIVGGKLVKAWDIPTIGPEVNETLLYQQLAGEVPYKVSMAYIERITKRPGMATGMDRLFVCYGVIRGQVAALRWPSRRVMPSVWKQALKVSTVGTRAAQDEACRSLATLLMPEGVSLWTRQRDVGRATAALIAYYGYRDLTANTKT